jgi:ABC-type molybdate transport system permease subunit
MNQENGGSKKPNFELVNLALSVSGQIGCMTLIVLIAAAFLGRWLDAQFATKGSFTLWLIIGSLPITLLLMYFMVRSTVKRVSSGSKPAQTPNENTGNNKED